MATEKTHYEYIIVGAGPAGVQMAYCMEKAKMDYLVVERNDGPGSFFRKFPRHRSLISINKKHNFFPEPEFNMRHDWNSLLNDDEKNPLLFTNYSDKLFPDADDLVKYLEDFCKKYPMNIRYNINIEKVHRDEMKDGQRSQSRFTITDDASGETFTSRVLLVGTGSCLPHTPEVPGVELIDTYQDHTLDIEEYTNKKVCVLGGGNSAFEVADHLAGSAAIIHIFNKHDIKCSWNTHFVGHLRAVNNNIIDMYHLKSLHALRQCDVTRVWKTEDGKFSIEYKMDLPNWNPPGTGHFVTSGYDKIISCTGWKFLNIDMFDDSCKPETHADGKYPVLDEHWQTTVNDMYFIGTPMQSRDQKSASGFIHGFRYNVRTLSRLLRHAYGNIELPKKVFSPIDQEEICKWIVDHVSVVSSLYQMIQGFLCDVMVINPDKVEYINELPQAWVKKQNWFKSAPLAIIVSIEDTIEKYLTFKPTHYITHADPNISDNKCSPFPQPMLRVFKEGKEVEVLLLGASLVVRADTKNFDGDNNPERYLNKIRNLFHRHTGIGKGGYVEELFSDEMMSKVYYPWTKEEIKAKIEIERALMNKTYECTGPV